MMVRIAQVIKFGLGLWSLVFGFKGGARVPRRDTVGWDDQLVSSAVPRRRRVR